MPCPGGKAVSLTKVPRPVSPLTSPMAASSAYTRLAVAKARPLAAAS